jgi:hypothetical protein
MTIEERVTELEQSVIKLAELMERSSMIQGKMIASVIDLCDKLGVPRSEATTKFMEGITNESK